MRNITSDFLLALSEGYLFPAIFVSMNFASGPVFMWTGYGDRILNGQNYTGLGGLLSISTIADGSTVNARGVTVTVSGFDPKLLPAVMNEFLIGQPATIYFGLLAGEGLGLVGSTVVAWSGRTDQPTITVPGPESASISINLESILQDMNTALPWRYTNQDQQLFHPGDAGLLWVNAIQNVPLYWNQTANADGNP